MNLKVNVNFPTYYTDENINMNHEVYKNSLEMQLEDLFSHNILTEKYARTKLTINIDLFEFSCDILPFALMATTLALNEAAIEQKGILTCSNLALINDQIIVDPTLEEEKNSSFKLVFGSIIDLQETNLFLQNGTTNEDKFKKMVGTAIIMCESYQNYLISKM